MVKQRIVVFGAGGLAREVRWLIKDINSVSDSYEFLGYCVSDASATGLHDSAAEVLGDYGWLCENRREIDAIAIGIGNPIARLKVEAEIKRIMPDVLFPPLIHPTVILDRVSAQIGEGVQICAGVIGTVNIIFEAFSFCNLACTLGHEVCIGRGTVINPGANLSGGVVVGREVLIGTGAQILQYLRIGHGATVGAGAVVTRDVKDGMTVTGVPARVR